MNTRLHARTFVHACSRSGMLIVCFSYRWLTPGHPDPDGFHFKKIAKAVKKYLGGDDGMQQGAFVPPFKVIFEPLKIDRTEKEADVAIFWDFGSQ
uniref:Uncharacterized protein n=1 Tax=Chromera velia CCMP2878 TaxID=1169474 RepID=A0A0G4HUK3_9ALVE|eukprot:Cvel_8633.t1-p1 / transcript=Cvel_8633.t1 / gene=Cvel_8633 / organism=Chromera_velia_CCMP2878 / gene_product=hypothetical protein / transcript_product=hypothetical protein / location=Cvel_scaffold480:84483-84764(-) / protein_length=94 / sequence_SO=supercontig / SO=protein_coding / is_pseudo=false